MKKAKFFVFLFHLGKPIFESKMRAHLQHQRYVSFVRDRLGEADVENTTLK